MAFNGMSIYVCSELLSFFVNDILPRLTHSFVLVTGDSDLSVPREALSCEECNKLLSSPLLLRWFAQNTSCQLVTIVGEKLVQLPIGLDYHTIARDPHHPWKRLEEGSTPPQQEGILLSLRHSARPFFAREMKIYVNFSLSNDRFGQRRDFLRTVPSFLCAKERTFVRRTDNWKQITHYAFVASPFGNGMDCHRTWEALCLGAIPIVKAPCFRSLFEGLPVLVVNQWSDVTASLLRETVETFRSASPFPGLEKLELDY